MSSHRPNLIIHETSMHKEHAWDPHPAQEDFKVPLNLHIPADIRMGSNLKEPRDSKGNSPGSGPGTARL